MNSRLFFAIAVAIVLSGTALAAQKEKASGKPVAQDNLASFKKLAGDWVGKDGMSVTYAVTSGGTAVVETIHEGKGNDMITVITADNDGLALTHYCMMGNQPQMHATGPIGKSVPFKFVRATNLKSEKEMHMHNVTYTFVDKDTLKTDWTNYVDGKPAGNVAFDLKRKK